MNIKSMAPNLALVVLVSAMLFFPSTAQACRAPRPSPLAVVSGAETIIRATATKYLKAPDGNLRQLNEPGDAEIEFTIEEILKGKPGSSTIMLNGYLTDRDDFNDRPVPYDFVRPGGRGGSCSAYEYRQGAAFLLFLKKIDGKLTVRWYALAPTNEQLHSASDPWLAWVRERLKSSDRREPNFETAASLMPFLTLRSSFSGRPIKACSGRALSMSLMRGLSLAPVSARR